MPARIVDRGRGPEISGTRVTVYRIMDYLREQATPTRIAEELQLTADEVGAAVEYIDSNRTDVEAAFESILQHREQQRAKVAPVPPTPDELKQRIARRAEEATHAGPSR